MSRTRSAASPPPRRSGASDRPRSVRTLTHRSKKAAGKVVPVEQPFVAEQSIDSRQQLISLHAEAREERARAGSFGPAGIVGVVVTCLVIFLVWWFLPVSFLKPEPIQLPAVVSETTTSTVSPTVQFVPVSSPSSTERRLLVPLPSSSTSSPSLP